MINKLLKTSMILLLPVLLMTTVNAGQKTAFTVKGMACAENCKPEVEKILYSLDHISTVEVSYERNEASVNTDGDPDREKIRRALEEKGYIAVFEEDAPPEPLSDEERASLDFDLIEEADAIDFEAHLAEEKTTIFYFYADWCKSCKAFTPYLENWILDNGETIALRKVDIENWRNPLGEQLTEQYGLEGIPFLVVYNADGEEVGTMEGAALSMLEKLTDLNSSR